MGFLSRKPASPETQLTALQKRRADLEQRLAAAKQHADTAAEIRRDLLSHGELDDPKLERAEAACRAADDRMAALEDALRHVAGQILDVERAIAGAAEKHERERVAGELEARAARLEDAATDLDETAEKFDRARARLVNICFADAPPADVFGTNPVGSIVGAGARKAGAVPRLDVHTAMGLPMSAREAAAPVVGQLRTEAKAVRAGDRPATLPPAVEPYSAPPAIPEERIVLWRPVSFVDARGTLIHLTPGEGAAPQPVVERCLNLGVGVEPGTEPARIILRILASAPSAIIIRNADGSFTTSRVNAGRSSTPPEGWQYLGEIIDGQMSPLSELAPAEAVFSAAPVAAAAPRRVVPLPGAAHAEARA